MAEQVGGTGQAGHRALQLVQNPHPGDRTDQTDRSIPEVGHAIGVPGLDLHPDIAGPGKLRVGRKRGPARRQVEQNRPPQQPVHQAPKALSRGLRPGMQVIDESGRPCERLWSDRGELHANRHGTRVPQGARHGAARPFRLHAHPNAHPIQGMRAVPIVSEPPRTPRMTE
jgi:hypothetical protein